MWVQKEPVDPVHSGELLPPPVSFVPLSFIPSPCNNDNKMGYSSAQMAWKKTRVVRHYHPKLLCLFWAVTKVMLMKWTRDSGLGWLQIQLSCSEKTLAILVLLYSYVHVSLAFISKKPKCAIFFFLPTGMHFLYVVIRKPESLLIPVSNQFQRTLSYLHKSWKTGF